MIQTADAIKNEKGFEVVFQNPSFKCAFITAAKQYSYGEVSCLKRHNKTDEIFVLLCGTALMLTYEDGVFVKTVLEKNKAFNVTSGTWHYLAVSEDGKIFVVEKSDTSAENTDVLELDNVYLLKDSL